MTNPKMTINEVVADMRSIGMKVGHGTVSDGIVSGLFPFGKLLAESPSGRRTFIILRKEYEKWKESVSLEAVEAPVSINKPFPEVRSDWELESTNTFTQEDKDIMWEVIIRSWRRESPSNTNG